MKENQIYLDFAATSPVDPRVVEEMMPFYTENFGNPSSIHWMGQKAEASLEDVRERIAELINSQTHEIIFTGSGTESDNLALRGLALSAQQTKGANEILISPVEHSAVLNTGSNLGSYFGFDLKFLAIDKFGLVDLDEFRNQISQNTAVVAVIYGNNEIGSINPISAIGEICR